MSDSIKAIVAKAQEMREVEKRIKLLKHELEFYEQKHKTISSDELPSMMADIRLKQFALDDGTQLKVIPVFVVNSPPKDKLDEVDKWLTDNGHGGMVKKHIDVQLPKSDEEVREIECILVENDIEYELKKSIHYQTLNKWGREMEEEGMVIPEDIFTIYRSTKTVIE
jgi:hypothetical protein